MTRSPKKSVKLVSRLETIPHELVTEILGRVAASSVTDMFNAKLSCKSLYEISEDMHVYKRVSLGKFPVVPWNPLSERQESFLNKCREHENPELMYREAVVDYFNRRNIRSTHKKLQKALKQGHVGALYVTCIVLLLSHDQESKRKGITILANLKKHTSSRDKLKSSRKELIKILDQMWVKNPILIDPPTCCTRRHERQRKSQWCEEEDVIDCEACAADLEISSICSKYNY